MDAKIDLEDVQGLLRHGYGTLPHAAFLLFSVKDAEGTRALLNQWAAEVTTSAAEAGETALHVAISAPGLRAIGLPSEVVEGFSPQFVEGMGTEHRSRLLGDVGEVDPRSWVWGGTSTSEVHLLLLVYALTAESVDQKVAELNRAAEGALTLLANLDTDELSGHEPFGFRDGISQPRLAGIPGSDDVDRALPPGEFLLGYPNIYNQLTERPLLDPSVDRGNVLPRDTGGSGAADLGRNGSYLVFRQLRQDVDAFWSYVRDHARRRNGAPDQEAQRRFAAKLVGRWPSGAPLVLAPDIDDPDMAGQDFDYHNSDPHGLACPIGAHIRRANPRDSLEPQPGSAASLAVNDRHRLLRRGRSYTAEGQHGTRGQRTERGLHFLCLNANLARQYEFVQHSWINDPTFNGLHDDADPIVAPWEERGTTFIEQDQTVRRRHRGVPAFVQVRGGGYFFMPGVSALRYLAQVT
jgi:Dyp-type peroxidase family